ncbi:MAG TPA: phosphotransferase [Gemmatimonadaceae bacterium]|nr:phosphotransferase [Gemmatimonadaceae bacterium]
MSSYPWEPDRLLTLEGARSAINTCFPEIDTRGLAHIGSGWEFDAYLTSDDWVFRFPRRAYCADFFEPEAHVHRLVSEYLPSTIAVPRVQLIGQPTKEFPYRFAGHRFIPGIAADGLDTRLLPALARDIGAAFGALHSIPEQAARAGGVAEMPMDDLGQKEWFDRGLVLAAELRGLDPVVDAAVHWMGELTLPLHPYDGPLHVIHHDMGPDHLIVDPGTGRLVGIIDWTDAILGDPARDFAVLVTSLGWDFTEAALGSYPLAVDRGFRERLRFLARLLSVMWLAEAHEQRADVVKHVDWVRNACATDNATTYAARNQT